MRQIRVFYVELAPNSDLAAAWVATFRSLTDVPLFFATANRCEQEEAFLSFTRTSQPDYDLDLIDAAQARIWSYRMEDETAFPQLLDLHQPLGEQLAQCINLEILDDPEEEYLTLMISGPIGQWSSSPEAPR